MEPVCTALGQGSEPEKSTPLQGCRWVLSEGTVLKMSLVEICIFTPHNSPCESHESRSRCYHLFKEYCQAPISA